MSRHPTPWTTVEKYGLLIQIIDQLSKDGRKIKWVELDIPGRTPATARKALERVRKEVSAAKGEGASSSGVGPSGMGPSSMDPSGMGPSGVGPSGVGGSEGTTAIVPLKRLYADDQGDDANNDAGDNADPGRKAATFASAPVQGLTPNEVEAGEWQAQEAQMSEIPAPKPRAWNAQAEQEAGVDDQGETAMSRFQRLDAEINASFLRVMK